MKKTDVFLIVGLGLMGGSYAMGLSQSGCRVTAVDKDEATLQWALQKGIIAKGSAPSAAEELVREADYIIVALYPKDILPWLRQNKDHFKKGALVTDLAGVKSGFVPQAQELLGARNEFIASHPMAGRELRGVENADDGIFTGANFLIVPTEHNTQRGIDFAQTLARQLGFGRVTQLSLQQHDRMIGYVSQLTHAIAVSLMNANDDPLLPRVTGDSFRELTRIADINDELWSELFFENAEALTQEIDDFIKCLQELRQNLASGDEPGLRALLQSSARRRRQFNKTGIEGKAEA